MDEKELQEEVEKRLRDVEKAYGIVPFILKMIAGEPELFVAYSDFVKNLMLEPKNLDIKMLELIAVGAGSALGADHCLDVHLQQALNHGATKGEIFEAIMVGSFMAMTNDQAHALRRYNEVIAKM